jgi:hypothetical protein
LNLSGPDRAELVADIEGRIFELLGHAFGENKSSGVKKFFDSEQMATKANTRD